MAGVTHPDAWHALVDHLSARGIHPVFGLPGDDLAVLRALDSRGVPAVLCRDQRAAVYMATGYAIQSGRPAVCLVGKGPAVTNTATGLLEARYSHAPVVLVAGGTGADRRGSGAFQEVDQVPLVAGLVKWSHRVDDPARVAPAIVRAFQMAAHGVPGPVYLEIPDHLIGVPVPQPLPWPDEPIRTAGVDGAVDLLVPVIRAARRPVLLLGGGLRHAGAQPAVGDFAARIGAAVFVTASGRGTVDEDDPAFCGLAGLYAPGPARRLWRTTDLVIALGTGLEETAVDPAGFAGRDVPVVQVNIDPAGWSAEVAGPRVLGDGVAVVRRWLRLLERDAAAGRDDAWAAAVADCRRETHEQAAARRATMAGSERIHVAELLAALDAAAPPDRILVQENGLQDMWSYCYPYWTCRAGSGSVVPSEHTSLGFGAAAAAGVALAAPGRLVAALVGDGAFAVAHGELRGLADAGVGVLYLVLRNGGYGWLAHQWQPLSGGHSRYRFVDPAASLCLPRDDRLWHSVVDRKADLDDALRTALTVVGKGLPAILEIPVQLDDVPPPADHPAGREEPAREEEEVPQ